MFNKIEQRDVILKIELKVSLPATSRFSPWALKFVPYL